MSRVLAVQKENIRNVVVKINKVMKSKIKKWKVLSRKAVFEKYGRKIEKVVFRLSNGKDSDFYILNIEKPIVCILALTKRKQIVLVKQFRPGPNQILMEMPGGYGNKNEEQIKTAERELLEETGYKGKLKLVAKCIDDGYTTIDRFCYVATDCEKVSDQKLDESEFAEVNLLSINNFRKLLRSGRMTDVEVGYLCLDYLGLL